MIIICTQENCELYFFSGFNLYCFEHAVESIYLTFQRVFIKTAIVENPKYKFTTAACT